MPRPESTDPQYLYPELKERQNLIIGGLQIQNRNKSAGIGTLGCVVFDVNDVNSEKPLGLSNRHILYTVGTDVIQPCKKPRTNEFIIGNIIRQGANTDYTDYAVFEIDTELRDYDRENSIHKLNGRITETVKPYDGMEVQKVGQYTGHTYGLVYNINEKNGTFGIKPNPKKKVKQISKGGDSGSLWVTDEENFKAVGLHITGEGKRWFFGRWRNPKPDRATAIMIDKVLTDLNIRF